MRILSLILVTVAALAQNSSPQFEVASIKPSPPPDGRGMRVSSKGGPGTDDPGMFNCENCELTGLITMAYGIPRYQITAPAWLSETRFMISAKIPPGTTKEQFRQMQQSLLLDRFMLAIHHEQKEMGMYDLVIAKGGPKMKESSPAAPESDDDDKHLDWSKKDDRGFPILPGKQAMGMMTKNRAVRRAVAESMADLAGQLGGQLNMPVHDVTGLKGKYDYTLYWIPDRAAMSGEEPGPTLLQAVEQQLGLKLERKKGMVDIIVVDHIEKVPTEN